MDEGASAMNKTLNESLRDITGAVTAASEQMAERMTTSSAAAAAEVSDTVGSVIRYLQSAAESLDQSTRRSEQVLSGMTSFVEELNELRGTIESTHRHIGVCGGACRTCCPRDPRSERQNSRDVIDDKRRGRPHGRSRECARAAPAIHSKRLDADTRNDSKTSTSHLQRFSNRSTKGCRGIASKYVSSPTNLTRRLRGPSEIWAGATAELSDSIEDLIPRLPGSSR